MRDDTRTKIRQTIRRIREFGRDIKSLAYVTSVVVPALDSEEEILSEEFGIPIRIRDGKYISLHVNDSIQTIQAFNSFLEPHLAFLREIGSARTVGKHESLPARTLCVFLGQEMERRRGNTQMLEAVTDSLILWALEGTDPDAGVFLTRPEILEKVEGTIPAAREFFRGELDVRLERLASKDRTDGRSIRWYRREDKFCLPRELRELVEAENEEDEILRVSVSDVFRIRVAPWVTLSDNQITVETVVKACHRTLEIAFESRGLEMAYFVTDAEPDDYADPSIADCLERALDDMGVAGKFAVRIAELCLKVLRGTLYDSSEEERIYLGKMSRTYVLLFLLKNDPKIVEYFRSMSSEFVLYLGTDIVIYALSEYFLLPDDQMTTNSLSIMSAAGAELVITEKCVEEVWTHLKATDLEFVNNYMQVEPYFDVDLARQIDRILIRSYFYARLEPERGVKKPAGWRSFIGTFCEYGDLHTQAGRTQIQEYLISRFRSTFEDEQTILKGVDPEQIEDLTVRIMEERGQSRNTADKREILARNDAMHVLRIYARRRELEERNRANPYGFKTWWLTRDASVRRGASREIVSNHARFMMRPEFILHFISASPSAAMVTKSLATIFPSLLGTKLSNRLDSDVFDSTMREVRESFSLDPARAGVKMSGLSDQLKSDFMRRYD